MFEMFERENIFIWGVVSSIITMVVYLIVIISLRVYYKYLDKNKDGKSIEQRANEFVYGPEWFFCTVMEIVGSNTCILGVCYIYNLMLIYLSFLSDFFGVILIILIIVAVICNNLIDCVWLEKYWIKGKDFPQKNLRLMSSFGILILILAVSIYFDTQDYVQLELCIFGLVLGRFIYFDTSLKGVINELKDIFKCWPSFILETILMCMVLSLGLYYEVIDTNNLIESLFYIHIFYMIATGVAVRVLSDLI